MTDRLCVDCDYILFRFGASKLDILGGTLCSYAKEGREGECEKCGACRSEVVAGRERMHVGVAE